MQVVNGFNALCTELQKKGIIQPEGTPQPMTDAKEAMLKDVADKAIKGCCGDKSNGCTEETPGVQ